MEHQNHKKMASTNPHDFTGDYIPMPHEFNQPPPSPNRYNPMYRPWGVHGGSHPHPHYSRPPPSPRLHHQPIRNPREFGNEALMHQLMESTKQIFREVDTKMDSLISAFDEKMNTLAAQVQENTSRLVHLEEIQKKHFEDLQSHGRKLHGIERSLDNLWKNFDKETTSSSDNMDEITTCLGITAIKAHKAEKALEETRVNHQEAFSTILVLSEGQRQHTQAIRDVELSLIGRFNDLTGKTLALKGETSGTKKQVKQIDNRLRRIEETVQTCLQLETIEEKLNQFKEDGDHDQRSTHSHAKGNLKPLEDQPQS